ncbi:Transcriptional regulatory protein WalR [bacterium HR12]|nr:Transcriptional regulatory protein WalR [bacterium HR12]
MGSILAIEDDRTVGLVLEHVLETAGHEVRVARDVADGRGALAEGRYDLIVLDLNLPDGSGLDLLREIRQGGGASTPVLVLSGMRQEEVVVRGLRLGADDYVTKPFSPHELLARVERWLKARG